MTVLGTTDLDSAYWPHDVLKDLTGEARTKRLNKIRNYARFCISKNRMVNPGSWEAFTPEEKMIIGFYNDKIQELHRIRFKIIEEITPTKVGLFRHFYENGEKVGSTLKCKPKPVVNDIKPEESTSSWEL